MFTHNQITITQVNNGWMVVLPIIGGHFGSPSFMYETDEASLRRSARIMRDEMHGDPVLRDIQDQDMDIPTPKQPKLSDIKDKNISIFKTFEEVLEFLKSQVN